MIGKMFLWFQERIKRWTIPPLYWLLGTSAQIFEVEVFPYDTSGHKRTYVSTLTKSPINCLTVSVSPHRMSPMQISSIRLIFWILGRNIASLVLVFFEKACDLKM